MNATAPADSQVGQPVLACSGVSRTFGGLVALNSVTFQVDANEIFAVVGPNGAGKTTLFEVISGTTPANAGVVRFHDREIQAMRPDQISRLGLTRLFQTPVCFDSQTTLTNVLVGAMFASGSGNPAVSFRAAAIEDALDALEFFGLLGAQARPAGSLAIFEKKRLMLATGMAGKATVYLLDEPFSGLNADERASLTNIVRRLRTLGCTIVMIEHVMRAVQELADRMLVLHHGEKILEGEPSVVLRDAQMVEVYLGQAFETS